MARITAFRPGQSPPPVSIPTFIACSCRRLSSGMAPKSASNTRAPRGYASGACSGNGALKIIINPISWRRSGAKVPLFWDGYAALKGPLFHVTAGCCLKAVVGRSSLNVRERPTPKDADERPMAPGALVADCAGAEDWPQYLGIFSKQTHA